MPPPVSPLFLSERERERERERSAAPKVSVFLRGFALNNKEEALQTNKAKD